MKLFKGRKGLNKLGLSEFVHHGIKVDGSKISVGINVKMGQAIAIAN